MLLTKQILNSTTIKDLYDDNDKFKIAAFATFLFLVHPVQTQAVTYIVQRMTSLAGLFYFASIYFYMLGRNNFYKDPSLRNKLIFIIAFIFSAISFLFGLLSKQIAVTVPITIIICELLLIRNKKMKISWIIVGSISVILLFMGILMLTTIGLPIEADNTPRHVYLLTQIDVMFTYFRLLILPINQNIDYDFPMRYSLIDLEIIFKLFLLIAVVFFSVRMSGKNKLYAFGVLWFFVTISVESSIIPIRDVINEYRLYIPIFGFAVIASVSLLYISKKFFNQKKFLLFSSSLLIILAILSYNRNELWNDPEKMWTDVISKSPKKDRPYLARGSHYLRTNQVDVAISDFQKVLQLNKNEFRAYDNLGYAYQSKNQFDQAIRYHEVAIKMNPRSALSYNNRGVCYINKKEWDKAVTDFSTAISLYNDYTDAFFNLGYVYYFKKEYDNSIKYFTKALNLNPSYYDIYPYLVISYYRLGKLNLARNNYETMKRLEMKIPNSIRAVMEN
ncbi:MAG: tetratricopeptide repeat protein [Candidatus Paceibacterota bacterium]